MGWLHRKQRRWPLEPPTFPQVVAIVRDELQRQPAATLADLVDASKARHVRLGFRYDPVQIQRALAALTDPARSRSSKPSARST